MFEVRRRSTGRKTAQKGAFDMTEIVQARQKSNPPTQKRLALGLHPLFWRTGITLRDLNRLIAEMGREPVEQVLRGLGLLPPGFTLPE